MKDSLKWIVTGASFLLLIAAFFAGRMYTNSSRSQPNIVDSRPPSSYPAPEVSIVAQISRTRASEMLSRSSSLYGEGSSYSRHKRSKRKKSTKPETKKVEEVASPKDADPEMGFMPEDDQKLREAMERADRTEGGDRSLPHTEPDGR